MGYVRLLEKDIKKELKKEKYVPLLENRKLTFNLVVSIYNTLLSEGFLNKTQPKDQKQVVLQNRFDVFDALKNLKRFELLTDFAMYVNAWEFLTYDDTKVLNEMEVKAQNICKYTHVSFIELDNISRDYYLMEALMNVLKELTISQ